MSENRILNKINQPNDIKKLTRTELSQLPDEIREFLIENVSKTGGHLSSNLGVVELTMALHLFLDLPKDKLVFDVGHQAYVHKILTGRKDFSTLRQHGGMSGFPKASESDCDAFDTGHSSTSLSAAAGLVTARDLKGEKNKVVAVIGDGALGGGMVFEAMNNLGKLRSNLIIILNDNEMSIDRNVGGMANYLGHIRTNTSYTNFKNSLENTLDKIPGFGEKIVKKMKHSKDSLKSFFISGMFFEDLGITYIGPIDGHSVPQILKALDSASRVNKPVIIHCVTKKGKGYHFAEKNPGKFHGIGKFDVETGKEIRLGNMKSYTDSFSEAMLEIGRKKDNIIGITAAMEYGTGLRKFGTEHPNRFFDVGIAEQHAVTFAAAMAKSGFVPVVAIYSSFLQRSYDQILHDVCLTKQPVVFMIDRAGVTGADGETHQGIFDLSYLSHIPNLSVMAPKNCSELKKMLEYAVEFGGPVAIRYPRGTENETVMDLPVARIENGKSECLEEGTDVAVFAVGSVLDRAYELAGRLKKDGLSVGVYNARFVNPIDREAISEAAQKYRVIVSMEENVKRGGFGEAVAQLLTECNSKAYFLNISLDDSFIEHGKRDELLDCHGLDMSEAYGKIRRILG